MATNYGSIPTIKVWDLVLVPLQGEIDDDLAARMNQDVLDTIYNHDTRGLIVDVTGLWLMDSHLCSVLSRLAQAASLMGVDTVLCGLSAEIALTLQTMRLELPGVTTVPTLEEAFENLDVSGPPSFEERLLAGASGSEAHAEPDGGAR